MQSSAVECSTVQYSAAQCSRVQHTKVRCHLILAAQWDETIWPTVLAIFLYISRHLHLLIDIALVWSSGAAMEGGQSNTRQTGEIVFYLLLEMW